jgi:hypothetical protein
MLSILEGCLPLFPLNLLHHLIFNQMKLQAHLKKHPDSYFSSNIDFAFLPGSQRP